MATERTSLFTRSLDTIHPFFVQELKNREESEEKIALTCQMQLFFDSQSPGNFKARTVAQPEFHKCVLFLEKRNK